MLWFRRHSDSARRRPAGLLPTLGWMALAAAAALASAPPAHTADAAPAAVAADPWDVPAFTADPAAVLAAAAELPAPEKSEVEVLLSTVEQTFDADGLVASRTRMVYRLLDAAALDGGWAAVEVQWAPWYQERPEVRARVIAPGGSVRELDPSALTEAAVPGSDPSMFEDTRRLRAPLAGLSVGAVVETETVVRRQRPFFAAGENRRVILAEYAPVRRARVVLDLPEGLEIGFRGRDLAEPARRVENGREILTWEAADLRSLGDREPWLPPEDRQLGPTLDWATGLSWTAVANAYREIVDERIAGADLGDLLDGLGDPGEDRDAWLAALLTRLHRRVRYTGVELDEARIVPRTPAETLARGFGDCKDKAVLLVAALRQAGIPAHVALLKSGFFRSRVDPEMPGLGQFNHAIVHLPGDPATWIDATDPYSRPGELATGDRGRNALVIAPGTAGLTPIPESTAADNRMSMEVDLHLAETGKGRVIEVTEVHGALAASRRSRYHGDSRDELEERFEEHVEELYGSEELVSFEVSEPGDLTVPLRQRLEAAEATRVVADATEAVVVIQLAALARDLPAILLREPDEPRESPFAIERPYRAEVSARIHLPPGLALRKLPEDADDVLGPARFQRRYEVAEDGRRVDLHASFELDRQRLEPEDAVELREAIEALDKKNGATAVIWFDQTVHAHTAAGRLPEAIAEARRLMELHPDEALHAGQLAGALLAASLGAEARLAARLGTELEPESATAWALLGRVLTHDEVGRPYQPGYDRVGAIEALRRAAELDPDDHSVRGDLAIALEHAEDGVRYGETADLEDAVAIYGELSDHLQALGADRNLPIALLKLKRYDEMREAAEEIADEATRNQLIVTAVALADGPQAAVDEAVRRYSAAEARAEALANAGQDLLLMRRYAETAELARVAARQSPRAASLLTFAEVLDRAVPYEELIGDETDPKGLYVRLLASMIDGDEESAPSELLRLLARAVRDETDLEEVEEMFETLRPAMRQLIGDMPPGVVVDLAAASLTVTREGDDRLGHRIRFQGALGGQALDTVEFMVLEDGVLRVVGSLEQEPHQLGLEVLRRLDAGDPAGARQWLDWALDHPWSAGQVDDPFTADAFPHFWSEAGSEDPEVMRPAAAVLAAPTGAAGAIEALEAAREGAIGLQQARIDEALLIAYTAAGDGDGVAATIERLHDRIVGESPVLFLLALYGLGELERTDDMVALGRARLEADPDDHWALRALADLANDRGDFERSAALFERLLATGDELPGDLNNAAWLGLAMHSPPTAGDLELVRRSLTREEESSSALHTLAALLAASGQPAEARQVLLQSIELEGGPPDHHDLYVLGLLAEAYGLPDAAERYYLRAVEGADEDSLEDAISAASLARARAETLRRPPEVAAGR